MQEPVGWPDSLRALDSRRADYAVLFVDRLLDEAIHRGASDVHLTPADEGLDVRWRIDGVLQPIGRFPKGEATDVVGRLKVLSHLLTYRHDVPQEGRVRRSGSGVEMRVSSFPTLHGERAVVRLFGKDERLHDLAQLGFTAEIRDQLSRELDETTGVILVTGPAGSGKTTTAYACLRELVRRGGDGKSIVSLEDPIESPLGGIAQSQVSPDAGFTLSSGVRSLMRQDPEVIFVGEIRDADTAREVFQASLTGHLVLTTFHAGSAAGAICRLTDMGVEPYQLRSGIRAVLSQRLVRRICDCGETEDDANSHERERLGLPVKRLRRAVGCDSCGRTGYRGRLPVAELLRPEPNELGRAILSREDAASLGRLAEQSGMVPLFRRACAAVESGETSAAEVRRVLGWSNPT